MKLNESDKELFSALAKSQLGKQLSDYLDRLQDYICDARTWGEGDTKESAKQAAKVIKEYIVGKISQPKESKPGVVNEHE